MKTKTKTITQRTMQTNRQRIALSSLMLCCSFALVSCSGDKLNDLKQYVSEVKARPGSGVAPLPEAKPYEKFIYLDADLRDPFKPVVRAQASSTITNQLMPNMSRDKEVLEEFPLDTLRMVGSLDKDNAKWAILKTTEGFIYRVKVGSHIGKNFGKITGISDTEIQIVEIVPDGFGGWMEREASLVIED